MTMHFLCGIILSVWLIGFNSAQTNVSFPLRNQFKEWDRQISSMIVISFVIIAVRPWGYHVLRTTRLNKPFILLILPL